MTEYGKVLRHRKTPIPGLSMWELPVHGDNRGWFKENWQRQKMTDAGLPDFGPVQNNVSFNDSVGTTRGIHAEPWDKYVSVATGRVFGAWVDLREGPSFGAAFTAELDPSRAIFVPRGVGNAFQTLEPNTAYTYLVNDHWSSDGLYASLNLADETVAIPWPIPLEQSQLSAKDRINPRLAGVTPIPTRKTLVIGAGGQLGRALREVYADVRHVEFADRADLDLASPYFHESRRWRDYDVIINAAAFTAVDAAETQEGRAQAWTVNVVGVAALARLALANDITLVIVSSDYVFDGLGSAPYGEDHAVSPLSVYGHTKAAGEAIATTVARHYIVRTSWVVGDGPNFVRTMLSLAERGIDPTVVNDQRGRLTFAADLAQTIRRLVERRAPYGIYNATSSGPSYSWADIARRVFALSGHDPARITDVSTESYFASSTGQVAPRPRYSVLDLEKLASLGIRLPDVESGLRNYVRVNSSQSPGRMSESG